MTEFVRIFHRWTSLAFSLFVVAICSMPGLDRQTTQWVYYLPLAPLLLLMITGLYLFFQPLIVRVRRGCEN